MALISSEEAVPGPSVFPSGEPGVSGDFWGSQNTGVGSLSLLQGIFLTQVISHFKTERGTTLETLEQARASS